jgi:hypothetical protein
MIDIRNGRLRGHYFEQRDLYLIHDVILEPKQGNLYTSSGHLIEESTSWSRLSQYNSIPWNFIGKLRKIEGFGEKLEKEIIESISKGKEKIIF